MDASTFLRTYSSVSSENATACVSAYYALKEDSRTNLAVGDIAARALCLVSEMTQDVEIAPITTSTDPQHILLHGNPTGKAAIDAMNALERAFPGIKGRYWRFCGSQEIKDVVDWVDWKMNQGGFDTTALSKAIAFHAFLSDPTEENIHTMLTLNTNTQWLANELEREYPGTKGRYWELCGKHTEPGIPDWVDWKMGQGQCNIPMLLAATCKTPIVTNHASRAYPHLPPSPPPEAGCGSALVSPAKTQITSRTPPAVPYGGGARLTDPPGLTNETGSACYAISAWNLLLHNPNLRTLLARIPDVYTEQLYNPNRYIHTPTKAFRDLAIHHLQHIGNGPDHPLAGARTLIDALLTLSPPGAGHSFNEVSVLLAKLAEITKDPNNILQPQFTVINLDTQAIETRKEPLKIGLHENFDEAMKAIIGCPLPIMNNADEITHHSTSLFSTAPNDLVVEINRQRHQLGTVMELDDFYTLPSALCQDRTSGMYELSAFIYWTGGHYVYYHKMEDDQWIQINDEVLGALGAPAPA